MQLGLYLHLTWVFGVQSLRVLDTYHVLQPPSAVSASAVHGEDLAQQSSEPISTQVLPRLHGEDDLSKRLELLALLGQEGIPTEERYHRSDQILSPPHHIDKGAITTAVPIVLDDPPTAQDISEEVEDAGPFGVLAHPELRDKLEPEG
jgi:hypothetical protein